MVVATADGDGTAPLPLPIEADPTLIGVTIRAQAVFPSPCGPRGLAASNGLTIRVGSP